MDRGKNFFVSSPCTHSSVTSTIILTALKHFSDLTQFNSLLSKVHLHYNRTQTIKVYAKNFHMPLKKFKSVNVSIQVL